MILIKSIEKFSDDFLSLHTSYKDDFCLIDCPYFILNLRNNLQGKWNIAQVIQPLNDQ